MPVHAIVWIDHREAKIFGFDDEISYRRLENGEGDEPIHHKAGEVGPGHIRENTQYLRAVSDALGSANEIVIAGPAQAKTELMHWMSAHAPETALRVLGVEALDHPTHGEIVAFARHYFRAKDRMTPQLP